MHSSVFGFSPTKLEAYARTMIADYMPSTTESGLRDGSPNESLTLTWSAKEKALIERIRQSRMTDRTPIKRLAIAITIAGRTFARFGDFSLVLGQRKAGKTTILQYVVATAFIDGTVESVDTLLIRTAYCEGKDIVYIDTEGSAEDSFDFIEGVKRILGVEQMPTNFYLYHWREMTQKECREALELLFKLHPHMHLCIIDGVADIVSKPNDEGESNETVRFIMKSAGRSNACVLCVIHDNPVKAGQETKARGHFGSELERKASGAIAVEKNREEKRHYIKSRFLRKSDDFEPVMFWFEAGRPVSRLLTIEEKTRLADKNYYKLKELRLLRDRCFLGVSHKTKAELHVSIELYQPESPSKEARRKRRDRNLEELLKYNLVQMNEVDGQTVYVPLREIDEPPIPLMVLSD